MIKYKMSKAKLYLTVVVLCMFGNSYLYAQGCSDAGFCTINSFKPSGPDSSKALRNQFKTGAFFGKADNSISVYGTYFEYNRQVSKQIGLDAKLTTLAQNGNGISGFGLSDIFLNANYKANDKLKITLGTKIPLSKANSKNNNLPLPMDYQSALGTFDLILGIGYEIKRLHIVAAIQQPLTQNKNQFLASNYPINSELRTFQSTNKFERGGDVLLRLSYPMLLTSKLRLTPSILPIYHLSNDKYTDEFNIRKEITGSKGLTFNGNVFLDYEINRKNGIQFNMGVPFIVRDARPDGLTRSFIVNLEYILKF